MKTHGQETKDPFLCNCGPCKGYWKNLFNDGSKQFSYSSCQRSRGTCTLYQNREHMIKVGDRVLVHDRYPGSQFMEFGKKERFSGVYMKAYPIEAIVWKSKVPSLLTKDYKYQCSTLGVVKYVGVLDEKSIAPQVYVGVKLDDNVNSLENGIYNGKRYFHCAKGHGAFVKYNQVQPLKKPAKRPLVFGNQMFPSYETVRKRREERSALIEAIKSGSQESTMEILRNHKHRAQSAPCRMPPLQSTSTHSLQRPATSKPYYTRDTADMRYKDHLRQEERQRRLMMRESQQKESQGVTEERQLRKWKEEFGGDERAARMAETLRKLHLAYQDGLELNRADYHADSNESLDKLLS